MKTTVRILIGAAVLSIGYWWLFQRDDWTDSDVVGVSGLSVRHAPRGPGATSDTLTVCFTARSPDRRPALLGGELVLPADLLTQNASARPSGRLFGPSTFRTCDRKGAENGQYVGVDRLYYIGIGGDGIHRVCLARSDGVGWSPDSVATLNS